MVFRGTRRREAAEEDTTISEQVAHIGRRIRCMQKLPSPTAVNNDRASCHRRVSRAPLRAAVAAQAASRPRACCCRALFCFSLLLPASPCFWRREATSSHLMADCSGASRSRAVHVGPARDSRGARAHLGRPCALAPRHEAGTAHKGIDKDPLAPLAPRPLGWRL
jgi:hypothetical protein